MKTHSYHALIPLAIVFGAICATAEDITVHLDQPGANVSPTLAGNASGCIAWRVHWYDAVCKVFANERITRKPKGGKGIILMQFENEYDAFKCDNKQKMLRALYEAATNSGIDIPIFTCLTRECSREQ
jgi:hypothetical protein